MGRRPAVWRRGMVPVATLAALLGATSCVPDPPVSDPGSGVELSALRSTGGPDARLVDAHGRQVTLRGANFNHLGDYFVTDPRLPTVASLDEDDWDDAEAMGFNVVRLVTTWSAWEPVRGRYDVDYAARVVDAVRDANRHGMYVLVDLHQDAWSKHVYSPVDHVCPPGWQRTRGWDGAPEWATFTDGHETCSPDGKRESPPAVKAAWSNFYSNRDGIRDAFGALWGFIATQFAGNPGVAGFDLLNEPGPGFDEEGSIEGLAAAYRSAIASIRAAEARVAPGAPSHPIFFEPLNGFLPLVPFGFSDDPNLVFAPHTYAESFNDDAGTLDLAIYGYALAGRIYGTPVFLGEYGSYRDSAFNVNWASRVHRLVDQNLYAGDTWWQWEQACGDPHNTHFPLSEAEVLARLPGCADARSIQACPTRPSPRAVPGRLTGLVAHPCGPGPLEVRGSTAAVSTADLWFPSSAPTPPRVDGEGIVEVVEVRAVAGGYRVFVRVDGEYRIALA